MNQKNCDSSCPYVKLLGEDLMYSPVTFYRCQASSRGREPGEFGEPTDWYKCDSENHLECSWFLRESKLEDKLKGGNSN